MPHAFLEGPKGDRRKIKPVVASSALDDFYHEEAAPPKCACMYGVKTRIKICKETDIRIHPLYEMLHLGCDKGMQLSHGHGMDGNLSFWELDENHGIRL